MGNTLMSLLVRLGVDSTEFEKGITEAQKKTQATGKEISKLGGTITKTGAIATAGLTLPLALATGKMISDASDLNETVSKVGVVFGDQAAKVVEFGNNAAKALGMSKNEALTAAGTYGNLFRAMGMTEQVSSDMSIGLVTLAGDLASFNNMDPTVVMDALRSGLSGETEPLKRLGVNINEAILKTKAFEMGLWDGKGALDASAKAQATYALVMEQTTLAQGDFTRTADGLANSQRIMKAQLADVSAKLGTQLLPIALKVVSAISKLAEKFSNLSPAGQKMIFIIGGILMAIGPILTAVGTLMTVIGGLTTFLAGPAAAAIGAAIAPLLPVIGIVLAVIAVITLLYLAWKNNWFGIRDIAASVWEWLKTAVVNVANFIYTQFIKPYVDAYNWLAKTFGPLFAAIWNVIKAVAELVGTVIAGVWQNVILPALKAVWGFISNALLPVWQALSNFFTVSLLPVLKKVADFFSVTLAKVFADVTNWLNDKLSPAFKWLSDKISDLASWFNRLADNLRNLKNNLPDWLTPGSPTPLEIGITGVGEAVRKLSRLQLPELQAGWKQASLGAEVQPQDIRVTTPAPAKSDNTELVTLLREMVGKREPTAAEIGKAVWMAIQQSGAV